jgi:hypothetical protein
MSSNFVANFWKIFYLQFFKFVHLKLGAGVYATPTRFVGSVFSVRDVWNDRARNVAAGQQVHHVHKDYGCTDGWLFLWALRATIINFDLKSGESHIHELIGKDNKTIDDQVP